MRGVGVVAKDLHPLARQLLREPPVAAAVVERALRATGHVEDHVLRPLMVARGSADRLVEPVESVELRHVGAVQRSAHDRREIGTARPAIREPRPPAHHRVLALALQPADVGAVVDEAHTSKLPVYQAARVTVTNP